MVVIDLAHYVRRQRRFLRRLRIPVIRPKRARTACGGAYDVVTLHTLARLRSLDQSDRPFRYHATEYPRVTPLPPSYPAAFPPTSIQPKRYFSRLCRHYDHSYCSNRRYSLFYIADATPCTAHTVFSDRLCDCAAISTGPDLEIERRVSSCSTTTSRPPLVPFDILRQSRVLLLSSLEKRRARWTAFNPIR